eukprot:Awhi_evm1s4915
MGKGDEGKMINKVNVNTHDNDENESRQRIKNDNNHTNSASDKEGYPSDHQQHHRHLQKQHDDVHRKDKYRKVSTTGVRAVAIKKIKQSDGNENSNDNKNYDQDNFDGNDIVWASVKDPRILQDNRSVTLRKNGERDCFQAAPYENTSPKTNDKQDSKHQLQQQQQQQDIDTTYYKTSESSRTEMILSNSKRTLPEDDKIPKMSTHETRPRQTKSNRSKSSCDIDSSTRNDKLVSRRPKSSAEKAVEHEKSAKNKIDCSSTTTAKKSSERVARRIEKLSKGPHHTKKMDPKRRSSSSSSSSSSSTRNSCKAKDKTESDKANREKDNKLVQRHSNDCDDQYINDDNDENDHIQNRKKSSSHTRTKDKKTASSSRSNRSKRSLTLQGLKEKQSNKTTEIHKRKSCSSDVDFAANKSYSCRNEGKEKKKIENYNGKKHHSANTSAPTTSTPVKNISRQSRAQIDEIGNERLEIKEVEMDKTSYGFPFSDDLASKLISSQREEYKHHHEKESRYCYSTTTTTTTTTTTMQPSTPTLSKAWRCPFDDDLEIINNNNNLENNNHNNNLEIANHNLKRDKIAQFNLFEDDNHDDDDDNDDDEEEEEYMECSPTYY